MGLPKILVNRKWLLVDESLDIFIDHCQPNVPYTLHSFVEDNNMRFAASAHYYSNSKGQFSNSCISVGGTFTGIDRMGLFWSMIAEPEQRSGIRLMKKNVETPFLTRISVFEGHHSVEDVYLEKMAPLDCVTMERSYKAPDIRRVSIRECGIIATLFLPAGKGPYPGVIDLFGTAGGLIEHRSALLASRGFACLALAYFLHEDLPKNLNDVKFDYFISAINWLCDHSEVISHGIGVVGVSKGAELALLMAIHSEKVLATVAIGTAPCLCLADMAYSKEPSGYIKGHNIPDFEFKDDLNAVVPELPNEHIDNDIVFPIERAKGKLMFIAGDEDPFCIPKFLAALHLRLPENSDAIFNIYRGAGHLIEPPYAPHCQLSYHKVYQNHLYWGGQAKTHCIAQEESWKSILKFLKSAIIAHQISKI